MVLYLQYWRILRYYLLIFVHSKQINYHRFPDDALRSASIICRAPERVHLTRSGMDALRSASSGESSISIDSTDYMYLFQRNKGTT